MRFLAGFLVAAILYTGIMIVLFGRYWRQGRARRPVGAPTVNENRPMIEEHIDFPSSKKAELELMFDKQGGVRSSRCVR